MYRTIEEINKEYSQVIIDLGLAVAKCEELEDELIQTKAKTIQLKNTVKKLKEEAALLPATEGTK